MLAQGNTHHRNKHPVARFWANCFHKWCQSEHSVSRRETIINSRPGIKPSTRSQYTSEEILHNGDFPPKASRVLVFITFLDVFSHTTADHIHTHYIQPPPPSLCSFFSMFWSRVEGALQYNCLSGLLFIRRTWFVAPFRNISSFSVLVYPCALVVAWMSQQTERDTPW